MRERHARGSGGSRDICDDPTALSSTGRWLRDRLDQKGGSDEVDGIDRTDLTAWSCGVSLSDMQMATASAKRTNAPEPASDSRCPGSTPVPAPPSPPVAKHHLGSPEKSSWNWPPSGSRLVAGLLLALCFCLGFGGGALLQPAQATTALENRPPAAPAPHLVDPALEDSQIRAALVAIDSAHQSLEAAKLFTPKLLMARAFCDQARALLMRVKTPTQLLVEVETLEFQVKDRLEHKLSAAWLKACESRRRAPQDACKALDEIDRLAPSSSEWTEKTRKLRAELGTGCGAGEGGGSSHAGSKASWR